jgi:diguanylate cyclase (GGDEF)-like protein
METDVAATPEHHISGLYTNMLMDSLAARLPEGAIWSVLHRAGEKRSLQELKTSSSWSSYDQFKRLLQEAKVELDATPGARERRAEPIRLIDTEIAETVQALGSPGDVLAGTTDSSAMVPIRRYETTEVGPTEWTIREHFINGFAPYPEFCEFAAGQYALIPLFFGLKPAKVVEEECQCRGDSACLFRLRWVEGDGATSRAEYLEVRTQLLEARLEQLQGMVTDLASNERYEDVLQGIVRSSMRAAGAGGALMALEPRVPGGPRKIYSDGLSDPEADGIANDLLEGGAGRNDVDVVDVVSARHHYGVLAIGRHGGIFTSQARNALETYGRLAAAALDAGDALEEARNQANTAQVLLELSRSLAEIVSTEEMAAKVVRAVPDVIDCDRVALILDDGSWQGSGDGRFRLVASHGYPDDVLDFISSRSFTAEEVGAVSEYGLVERVDHLDEPHPVGTVAAVSAPISVAGNTIGYIVSSVTSNPQRLAITPRLADRLKGLAAQASISISNAQLLDQILFQAVHDTLTGLPNRALILDRTEQMLARARRTYVPVAALFIDLDGFKDVNDSLGHAVGDQLLQAVTARLTATMRESDSIGRLGGDEFVVLVDGTTMDVGPELVAERLLEILREPFEVEVGGALRLTASIGIAAGMRPSATELLRDADIALYQAKAAGKDCAVVFRPEMHRAVQDHHLLEMDLRVAYSGRQYFLNYQPIFNLKTGETIGVEALLRWRHPVRGVVQPDAFIPILESSGMITDVGRWVLEEACRQGAHWRSLGHELHVSVNVSARQLETDQLIEDIRRALKTSGFDARSLIVEITETSIMRNVSAVVPRLAALKETGVRIAIDDFGTGYSSLAYLQRFPVDILKIDRSFISTMADSPESGALVRTLVQLGKTLGLETLAEGIEETEQRSQLEREQCDSGQGYLFARPLDADAIEAFLADRSGGQGSREMLDVRVR